MEFHAITQNFKIYTQSAAKYLLKPHEVYQNSVENVLLKEFDLPHDICVIIVDDAVFDEAVLDELKDKGVVADVGDTAFKAHFKAYRHIDMHAAQVLGDVKISDRAYHFFRHLVARRGRQNIIKTEILHQKRNTNARQNPFARLARTLFQKRNFNPMRDAYETRLKLDEPSFRRLR